MAHDNTPECNTVAIKRLQANRKSIREIRPFTSDYVVSIKQSYMDGAGDSDQSFVSGTKSTYSIPTEREKGLT